MTEPRVAIDRLHAFGRDEALVGDILEEFEQRQSQRMLAAPDGRRNVHITR